MLTTTRTMLRATALLGTLGAVMWLLRPDLADVADVVTDPRGTVDAKGADAVVLVLAQICLLAILTWAAAITAVTALAAARPRPALQRLFLAVTPLAARSVIGLALGVSALTMSACASTAPPHTLPSTAPAYAASSDAFDWPSTPTPTPPPSSAQPPATTAPAAPATDLPADGVHVVQPGECLWSIAYELLGPSAPPRDAAYLVDAIYAANSSLIGADPNLLNSGMTLTLPAI